MEILQGLWSPVARGTGTSFWEAVFRDTKAVERMLLSVNF